MNTNEALNYWIDVYFLTIAKDYKILPTGNVYAYGVEWDERKKFCRPKASPMMHGYQIFTPTMVDDTEIIALFNGECIGTMYWSIARENAMRKDATQACCQKCRKTARYSVDCARKIK